MPLTILFLDVDGVLNSVASRMHPRHAKSSLMEASMPTSEALSHLARIVASTKCKIVLSSTWRLESAERDLIETALKSAGLAPLYGATPVSKDPVGGATDRVKEIKLWLSSCDRDVAAWLAIDDLDLQGWCPDDVPDDSFELTLDSVGLTAANADSAIAKMKRQQQMPSPKQEK